MDKFPEAFRRFENVVDIGRFESYHQLTLAFRHWPSERWRGTYRQWNALNKEAENVGFEVPDVTGKQYGRNDVPISMIGLVRGRERR